MHNINVKNLGTEIDNTSRFKCHINKQTKKSYFTLKMCRPYKQYLNETTKLQLCERFFYTGKEMLLMVFLFCSYHKICLLAFKNFANENVWTVWIV